VLDAHVLIVMGALQIYIDDDEKGENEARDSHIEREAGSGTGGRG